MFSASNFSLKASKISQIAFSTQSGRVQACVGVSDRSVRRGQGLSGLVGEVPTPLEEGGYNDPLTFIRKERGNNSMRRKRRETQRQGSIGVRK
jgi:hypothetical protein